MLKNEGGWVFQEPKERHAFSLCQVVDAGTADEWYDLLGVVRVPVDRRQPDRLKEQLRPWALATLAAGGYGFGSYHAAFGTLDEEGEPYRCLAEEEIAWSGNAVLVPAEAGVPSIGT
jgi:hypothetical protein